MMMFENLKAPRNITQYNLMQGVTDYGNLGQFNLFETGYSFLRVCKIPRFMEILAARYPDSIGVIVNNYKRILEFEFRGLDGLDNLTSETLEITNGISNVNLISKVVQQSAATVSMQFFEKSGSTITKFNEIFLRGIKDPLTEIKHYYGLIKDGTLEGGYENETFVLLYLVTDNTALQLERAYLLLAAQPTKADWDMYNSTKGEIDRKELTLEFNCFPVTGNTVNAKAKEMLDWMNNDENPDQIITDSSDYVYSGVNEISINKSVSY